MFLPLISDPRPYSPLASFITERSWEQQDSAGKNLLLPRPHTGNGSVSRTALPWKQYTVLEQCLCEISSVKTIIWCASMLKWHAYIHTFREHPYIKYMNYTDKRRLYFKYSVNHLKTRSQDSDWIRVRRSRHRSSSPGRNKFFLLSIQFWPVLGPTKLPIQWVKRALSSRGKRQSRSWPLTSN
jgi:hypothetical protein